jgi:hypothetical protein
MKVYLQIAFGNQIQPKTGMERKRMEHMVKETNACINVDLATVKTEADFYLRLLCNTLLHGSPFSSHLHNRPLYSANLIIESYTD